MGLHSQLGNINKNLDDRNKVRYLSAALQNHPAHPLRASVVPSVFANVRPFVSVVSWTAIKRPIIGRDVRVSQGVKPT
jgi:hypothetical protein